MNTIGGAAERLALAGLEALAGVARVLIRRPTGGAALAVLLALALTLDDGVVTHEALASQMFAGINGKIAFLSTRGDQTQQKFDIWVMDADGKNQQRLTTSADQEDKGELAWSPDGKRLAFVNTRQRPFGGEVTSIGIMDANGGNLVMIGERTRSPSWSPDGTMIAFYGFDDAGTYLAVVRSDGSNPRRLASNPGVSGAPTWSPDSRTIAFVAPYLSAGDIHTVPAAGGNPTRLSNDVHPRGDYNPIWSPDGTTIASSCSGGGICTMAADGSGHSRLTPPTPHYNPSWSPDGSRLVFAVSDGSSEIHVLGAGIDVAVTNTGDNFTPAWSPDGDRIAFMSYRDNTFGDIYVMRADGTGVKRLTMTGDNSEPVWQPIPAIAIGSRIQQIGATGTYLPPTPGARPAFTAPDFLAVAGIYRVTFTFRNVGPATYAGLQARITFLTPARAIMNRNGAPWSVPNSVGAVLSVSGTSFGPDGVLSPNEQFPLVIDVGLLDRSPFRIAFDGAGTPVESAAVRSAATERERSGSGADAFSGEGEFTLDGAPPTPTSTSTTAPMATMTPSPTVTASPSPSVPPAAPATPGHTPPTGNNAAACSPRPKIQVGTSSAGDGRLAAVVGTEVTAAVPNNALRAVRLIRLDNATVQVVGGPSLATGESYTPPSGAREVRLLVARTQPGPMTAHLEIEDDCGRHTTFVGAGAGVR